MPPNWSGPLLAFTALFDAAEAYAREHGKTCIEGPLNFGIYDEIGVLIDGFDTPPYVLNLHNPPYYQKLIESAGYGKSIDWFAYRGKRGETTFDVLDKRFIRLRDALLGLSGTPEGQPVLDELGIKGGFEAMNEEDAEFMIDLMDTLLD